MEVNYDLDILNKKKKLQYNNYLGNKCNDSFMELYDCSINLSIKRINGF